jgi:hypothetical protein
MDQAREPRESKSWGATGEASATTAPQERLPKLSCVMWDKQTPSPAWLVSCTEQKGMIVCLQHRASMGFVGVHGASVFLSEKVCFKTAARFSICKLLVGPFAGLLRLWHASGGFFSVSPTGDIVIAAELAGEAGETMLLNSLWRLERGGGDAVIFRNMWSGGLLAP